MLKDISIKGTPNQGLFGATLGFFVGFAAVSLFGPTVKEFTKVMDMSPLMVGLLVAMPSLSGSVLRIPFGAWVDTTGGRKPLLILLSLSLVGMLGIIMVIATLYPRHLTTAYYPLLLILGLLGGCGIATFSVGISQVSYWFPQARQGWALGTYGGLGNMAPGIFAFLLPLSLGSLGLLNTYLAWAAFLALGIALYYVIGVNAYYFQLRARGLAPDEARLVATEHGQSIFPAGTAKQSLAMAAKIWKTWALVAIYFTSFGGFIALTAWFPTYWTQLYRVDLVTAGTLTAVFSILASLIRVVGGTISDRLGGEATATGSISVMLMAALLLTISDHIALALVGAIVMAMGMGVTNAAVFKIVPREIKEAVGGASGWIGGVGAFGGFAIPPVMGLFVQAFGLRGYSLGFTTFIGLSALSLGLIYILRHTHIKQARSHVQAQVRGGAATSSQRHR